MTNKSYTIMAMLLMAIILIVCAIYWPGLNGPFLLDDRQNIVSAYLGGFSWDKLIYASSHNVSSSFGRPISALSIALSGMMHGPSAWGYKYHNLLIHLLNGLLIFWLLIRLMPHLDKTLVYKRCLIIAGVIAAGWALHPLMVSTVLYAVQRMAELSALFSLLAILAFVIARENISKNNLVFYFGLYCLFPFCLVLAVLSKESGALIPLYVLAIEVIVFKFRFNNDVEKKRVLSFLAIFVLLPIVLGGSYVLLNFGDLTSYSTRDFNVYERLMTESHVIFFYLKLILLPQLSEMSLFHDDFPVIRNFDYLTVFYVCLMLISIVLIFVLNNSMPVVSLGLAWFLISHLIESTFLDLELVFEHRNYLALLGVLLPCFYYLLRNEKSRILEFSACCFLVLLAVLTLFRVQEWKSEELIYTIALLEHPESPRVNTEYANFSYNVGERDRAIKHLRVVQDLNESEAGSIVHEMLFLCIGGLNVASEKFVEAESRLAKFPVTPYALNALENLIAKRDLNACSDIKTENILAMVQIARERAEGDFLGFLQRLEGKLHFIQGEYPQGVQDMLLSYENYAWAATLFELADVQLQYKQIEDAKWTLAKLEKINSASFGIEDTKMQKLKEKLGNLEINNEQLKH